MILKRAPAPPASDSEERAHEAQLGYSLVYSAGSASHQRQAKHRRGRSIPLSYQPCCRHATSRRFRYPGAFSEGNQKELENADKTTINAVNGAGATEATHRDTVEEEGMANGVKACVIPTSRKLSCTEVVVI